MERVTMTKIVQFAAFLLFLAPISLGCSKPDTSAVSTGVDDSVVQTEDQMEAMSAEYESQSQSK
jgi:hypothetical protein